MDEKLYKQHLFNICIEKLASALELYSSAKLVEDGEDPQMNALPSRFLVYRGLPIEFISHSLKVVQKCWKCWLFVASRNS